ncbi:hypothetical protein V6N13_042616 [Hibiscus sabdariffa]|uniref:Uncharacterized protein n=1 Tax=Hibiscus sabdariffa TaxID=183260 RepID=A0ABR1ZA42_9ROSI
MDMNLPEVGLSDTATEMSRAEKMIRRKQSTCLHWMEQMKCSICSKQSYWMRAVSVLQWKVALATASLCFLPSDVKDPRVILFVNDCIISSYELLVAIRRNL